MSINEPKNLESDFNNLSINPSWKKISIHGHGCAICRNSGRDQSFKNILVMPNCTCKIIKKQRPKFPILRPAKLNSTMAHRKSTKLILLKPPTFHIIPEKSKTDKIKPKITALSQNTSSVLPNFESNLFTNVKNDNQSSFKTQLPNPDTDILTAFDTLSFKELRSQPSKLQSLSDVSGSSSSKRENSSSSSCSVQARMESSLCTDCDDTSIEELASYFDLFVHIPKKMSSMAEMMYI